MFKKSQKCIMWCYCLQIYLQTITSHYALLALLKHYPGRHNVSHLAREIKRSGCYKHFFQYEKATIKCELNSLRIHFLKQCKRSELIPRFLKFRIPTNGCFDNKSVREFQLKLLHKELVRAKENFQSTEENVNNRKAKLLSLLPSELTSPVEDHIEHIRTNWLEWNGKLFMRKSS